MNTSLPSSRLAVCSWSLQPKDLSDLIAKLGQTGIHRVQLALDPLRLAPAQWPDVSRAFQSAGISIVSGMVACVGEDYASLESIRRTGGIAPDATWEENLRNFRVAAQFAADLGLKLVTFHAGFMPEDESHPDFAKMLHRLAAVGEVFAQQKISVALETGQEAAPLLASVLNKLDTANLGVNFDPANMILYFNRDPIEALHVLHPWIRQVHIKDARATRVPGTWGEEVAAGSGDVDWPRFFSTLLELHFTGNFVLEREAGAQRVIDLCAARDLVHRLAQ